MTEESPSDDTQLRQQMFDKYRDEQLTRERYNIDKYDSTILTFSTGTLALSLTFVDHIVPLVTARNVMLLKASWVLLVATMLLMLVSFPIAQAANTKSIEFARLYYIERVSDAFNRKCWQGITLAWLNPLAGVVFLAGICLITAFVWTNIQGHPAMTDKKNTSTPSHASDAMPSALMQKVTAVDPLNKAMPSANMTVVPTQTPAPIAATEPAQPVTSAVNPAPTPTPTKSSD